MKSFPVTTDQVQQIKAAQTAAAAALKPYQDAQAAVRKLVTSITGDPLTFRGWELTDDNAYLVIK